ncbi:MAG: hypothetical protein RSA06_00050 [Erysipelotrichaceae bacterium]
MTRYSIEGNRVKIITENIEEIMIRIFDEKFLVDKGGNVVTIINQNDSITISHKDTIIFKMIRIASNVYTIFDESKNLYTIELPHMHI